MSCKCIKEDGFFLDISFTDCQTLVIDEVSTWVDGDIKPDEIKVKVYSSSQNKETVIDLFTNNRNVFTSVELFGSVEPFCLPDDIYCFTLLEPYGCGYEITIARLYCCNLQCTIDEMISSKDKEKEGLKLNNQLKAIRSMVESGSSDKAQEALNDLREQIKMLDCDNC